MSCHSPSHSCAVRSHRPDKVQGKPPDLNYLRCSLEAPGTNVYILHVLFIVCFILGNGPRKIGIFISDYS